MQFNVKNHSKTIDIYTNSAILCSVPERRSGNVSKNNELLGSVERKRTPQAPDFAGSKAGRKNLLDFRVWAQPL